MKNKSEARDSPYTRQFRPSKETRTCKQRSWNKKSRHWHIDVAHAQNMNCFLIYLLLIGLLCNSSSLVCSLLQCKNAAQVSEECQRGNGRRLGVASTCCELLGSIYAHPRTQCVYIHTRVHVCMQTDAYTCVYKYRNNTNYSEFKPLRTAMVHPFLLSFFFSQPGSPNVCAQIQHL